MICCCTYTYKTFTHFKLFPLAGNIITRFCFNNRAIKGWKMILCALSSQCKWKWHRTKSCSGREPQHAKKTNMFNHVTTVPSDEPMLKIKHQEWTQLLPYWKQACVEWNTSTYMCNHSVLFTLGSVYYRGKGCRQLIWLVETVIPFVKLKWERRIEVQKDKLIE